MKRTAQSLNVSTFHFSWYSNRIVVGEKLGGMSLNEAQPTDRVNGTRAEETTE